jgi:hypothetical protein
MLLQTNQVPPDWEYIDTVPNWSEYFNLQKKYKDMRIIRKYDYTWDAIKFKDFEWIEKII